MAMQDTDISVKLERGTFLFTLVAVSVAFALLLKPFFAPIFWACAIGVIFYPFQKRLLAKWPHRRNLVSLCTLFLCVVLVVIPVLVVASSFVTEGVSLFQKVQSGELNLADYVDRIKQAFPWLQSAAERFDIDLERIKSQTVEAFTGAGQFLAKRALAVGQNTFQFFLNLGLMLYLAFFLIRDGDAMVSMLIRALPLGDEREKLLFAKFAEVTRATIKGNLLVAATQGALGGLIFWWLGIPGALLWGVVMAVLSLIPAVGAGLIWLPVSLYLYAVGDILNATILVLFGIFVIGLVDNILRPILVGRDTKLPDYVVLFSTLGGLAMFGITGFALGPLLAALFVAFWGIFIREFNEGESPAALLEQQGSSEESPGSEAS
ncbi:MAG: AI-2E family transporter [Alcanivorax jadensis]|jgi:predicted PurR-regulated permease PerM|uniref:AI-2E family transporter n=2 Tax=Alcanivoracaceae TaxID=224372 RepID=UPI003001C12C